MTIQIAGQEQGNNLISGVTHLFEEGMWGLSILVFLTSILLPGLKILGMLYILVCLRLNRSPCWLGPTFRMIQTFTPWGMMEVYMLGVLVALVKLADLVTIVPGIALYSFAALIVIMAASFVSFEQSKQAIEVLVKRGLRAQLQTGSLLTGKLFISVNGQLN